MGSGWPLRRLADLGEVVTGTTPPSAEPELFGEVYPFLTPTDMDYDARRVATGRLISEEARRRFASRMVAGQSVCFVCIGATIGKVAMTQVPTLTNQQINSIIVDPTEHHPAFVYYLLRQHALGIRQQAGGAATPIINKTAFSSIELPVPPLPVQQRIGAVLAAYDELIENNLRQIEILEEMAQAVYREWFVNFRFPGHEDVALIDSPLGPIPEGWEATAVGEAFDILGGATPSTKRSEYWDGGTINWYTPSDLTAHGQMFIKGSSRRITPEGLDGCSATLFPAGSVMMTSRATLGVVSINTEPACTNQGFITCLPTDGVSSHLIYFWIKNRASLIESLATGATFKEITKRAFRQIAFLVPSVQVGGSFRSTVNPIMALVANLIDQNANLRSTRDLLLPKLVSGEIDVSDLDIETEWLAS